MRVGKPEQQLEDRAGFISLTPLTLSYTFHRQLSKQLAVSSVIFSVHAHAADSNQAFSVLSPSSSLVVPFPHFRSRKRLRQEKTSQLVGQNTIMGSPGIADMGIVWLATCSIGSLWMAMFLGRYVTGAIIKHGPGSMRLFPVR